MSGRQCCTALAQCARSRPQNLRPQRLGRHETPRQQARRPLHTTPSYLAAAGPVKTTSPPTDPNSPNPKPTPGRDAPAIQKFASQLRSGAMAGTTEPYAAYGTTEKLFKACSAAGDYTLSPLAGTPPTSSDPLTATTTASAPSASTPTPPAAHKLPSGEDVAYPATPRTWHTPYSLLPTFSTWSQLTFLHMYLLLLRIRQFPPDHARRWEQNLINHFSYNAEERMTDVHNIGMRGVRSKYLKDLFDQWRGAVVSYDEGMVKGDAVLAAAVWRNVFQGRGDVDVVAVAEVVAWLRRGAEGLSRLDDAEFAAAGWSFGTPWSAGRVVERESEGVRQPVEEEGRAGS